MPAEEYPELARNLNPTAPVQCPHCNRMFPQKTNLNTHNRLRRERGGACPQVSPGNKRSKKPPRTRVEKNKGPVECTVCGRWFTRWDGLVAHDLVRLERGTCPNSNGKGPESRKRVGKPPDPFKCEVCGRMFKHRRNLVRHNKVCEEREETGAEVRLEEDAKPAPSHHEIAKPPMPLKCSVCSRTFVRKAGFTIHRKLRLQRGTCPRAPPRMKDPKPSLPHEARKHSMPLKCSVCSQTFIRKADLITHQKLRLERGGRCLRLLRRLEEHPESTCLYPGCSASFPSIEDMLKHMHDPIHTPLRPSPVVDDHDRCPEGCGASMRGSNNRLKNRLRFAAHLERKHSWCVICSVPFTSTDQLAQHMREIHRAQQPTHCCPSAGCGFSFGSHDELLMHFWWSGSDHLRVVRLEGVNGDVHWCCPFCGDLRLFGEEQLAAVHFQALHRPVGVGIGDLEGRDMELTASSVEMGSIEGETWSSMETAMTEEGTYSSLETTVGTNSYSSMETLPEAPTSNSMEMISVDSDQRDDPHTDELPAGGIERPTQIDSVRGTLSSWGVQLCDTPETCYSCGNLVEQMGMRWAEPGSRVSLN